MSKHFTPTLQHSATVTDPVEIKFELNQIWIMAGDTMIVKVTRTCTRVRFSDTIDVSLKKNDKLTLDEILRMAVEKLI